MSTPAPAEMYEVVCQRCGQVICHLDYPPGPSVHFKCPDPNQPKDEFEED